jgi:hypothetical protein
VAFLVLGRLEEAVRIADEFEPLARKIGHSIYVALCLNARAWIEFGKALDLAKLEAAFQRVPNADQEASSAQMEAVSEVPLSLIDFFAENGQALYCMPKPPAARASEPYRGVRRWNAFSTDGVCGRSRRRICKP